MLHSPRAVPHFQIGNERALKLRNHLQMNEAITFVVPVAGGRRVLEENFLLSPILRTGHEHQVLVMADYESAAAAYNAGIDRALNDVIVFVHQDVFLPQFWVDRLWASIRYLNQHDPEWGVLGCYGVAADGTRHGWVYSSPQGVIGRPFSPPERVRTLDEIVLIFRKSSGLRFDESLPHFHMYGTDICLHAAAEGRNNYSVPAFCLHNTNSYLILPPEFYRCYRYVQSKWRHVLPVETPCITITKTGANVYLRRANEYRLRITRGAHRDRYRISDVEAKWQSLQTMVARAGIGANPREVAAGIEERP
jgi:hypothetical protein